MTRNPTSVKIPDNLIPYLEFLKEPVAFYEQGKTLQFVPFNFDKNHSSPLLNNDTDTPERGLLKTTIVKCTAIAKELFDRKDSIGLKQLNMSIGTLSGFLKEISKQAVTKDNTETGMFQKYFVGFQSLDSCYIFAAEFVGKQLQTLANKHSPQIT